MYTYKLPLKSDKKDFIFNMLGSTVNAAVSILLLIVVSQVVGSSGAGTFSLAYSTSQMMYTICVFEMRNIQVTDAKGEFNFSQVFAFRIITTIFMWLFFIFFVAIKGYSGDKLAVMALLSGFMSLLALSDVFQGAMHLKGYLQLAGKSLALQVIIATVVFSISLIATRNLILSVALMIVAVLLWIFIYDIPYTRNFELLKTDFAFSVQKSIFFCALPLFISSFLHQYIFNSQKYAIDSFLTSTDQSHYGYLVMPAFFINLLSIFVFRPQLISLSQNWVQHKYKAFKKTVSVLFLWIVIVSIAALFVGYLLGIPVLEFLYSADLSGKRHLLMILLLSGTFGACCSLTGTLLTILRKQKFSLIAYAFTFLISLFLPEILVEKHGMLGATLSYLAEMMVLFAAMLIIFVIALSKAERIYNNER